MKKNSIKNLIACLCLMAMAGIFLTACGNEVASDKPHYYNEDNVSRYEAYAELKPDLTEDEVIWHVEADIDKTPYDDMTVIAEEDENNDILLVNKHFCFRDDFVPKDLVAVESKGQKATSKTAKAYEEMKVDAAKKGYSLNVRSGYRSVDLQRIYYSSYKKAYGQEEADKYSAQATTSEHHTGRALDIVENDWSFDNFQYTDTCKWLHENAWKYGFILRYAEDITDVTGYAYESWHMTYVGKEVAKIMHEEGIASLEEYWVKYIKFNVDSARVVV